MKAYRTILFSLISLSVIFVIFISETSAVTDSIPVTNMLTYEKKTFKLYKSKLDSLQSATQARRRDFESINTYNSRIEKSVREYNAFLNNTYMLRFSPKSVSLDWENSTVNIDEPMPTVVLRTRGGRNASNKLRITIPIAPNKARLIKTFPNSIIVELKFYFDRNSNTIIDKLDVKYNEERIYAE